MTRWDAPPQDAKSVDLICYRLIISDQSSNGSFYGDMSLYRIVYEDGTENSIDYPHSVFIENGYVCPDKQDISFEWSELQFEGKVNDKAFPDSMSGTWSVGWLAGPWEAQKQ